MTDTATYTNYFLSKEKCPYLEKKNPSKRESKFKLISEIYHAYPFYFASGSIYQPDSKTA